MAAGVASPRASWRARSRASGHRRAHCGHGWARPSGRQAYRVGPDLVERFPACARPAFEHRADGLHLDLYAAARALLRESGVESVHGGHWCTATQAQRFFSHRRDRVTGRMATFIWIAAPGR